MSDFLPVEGFLEAFHRHLEEDPLRVACAAVRPSAGEWEAEEFTYRDLSLRAASARRQIEAHGLRPGDRVLFCVGRPERLLVGMLACWANGYVPVPLPAVDDLQVPAAFAERIASVQADCTPRLVVVEDLGRWLATRRDAGLPVLEASTMEASPSEEPLPRHPEGEIAFLQYTSGSTGQPRGVVVTHENLAANARAIGAGSEVSPCDRSVSWLPLHHDMGLVGGLLFPIYARIPAYVLSPLTFIARPATWLRAMHHFRGTYSVAPNFAYSLCARRVAERDLRGVDLSSWRLAFNGAEPIDSESVLAFIDRFRPYGFRATSFYPVYGLAESTLAVAFPPPGAPPIYDTVHRGELVSERVARQAKASDADAATFVSVGAALPGHRIEVRDPETEAPLGERCVGEVVAFGPSVSPRYFGDPEETRRDGLRTGDLGYIAEGRLYVVDRLKDLVIVAGKKYSPADIERVASRVKGVRMGRVVAFSLPGAEGTEELHLVAEFDARAMRGEAAIREEVSQLLQRQVGIATKEVLLVAPGLLPRTTSGKVRRRAGRDLYVQGKLSGTLGGRMGMLVRSVLNRIAALAPML